MVLFSLVALSDRRGRLLMQERDARAPVDPLRWGLPGGSREQGETPLDNARRELEEETGLTGLDLIEVVRASHFHPDIGWFDYAVFGAVADVEDEEVACHEGLQMVFRPPAEIWGLDLSPTSARVLPTVLTQPPYSQAHGPAEVPRVHRFASVLLVDREGRVLLQERDEHPVIDPERWGFPGGHVEEGEAYEVAARRELEEETGVCLDPGALQLFGEFVVDHRSAYGSWDILQLFVAATDLADADIDCREGRRIVFVDAHTAGGLPLTSAAASILPAFLDSDHYRHLKEQP